MAIESVNLEITEDEGGVFIESNKESSLSLDRTLLLNINNNASPVHLYIELSNSLQREVEISENNVFLEDDRIISLRAGKTESEINGEITLNLNHGETTKVIPVSVEPGGDEATTDIGYTEPIPTSQGGFNPVEIMITGLIGFSILLLLLFTLILGWYVITMTILLAVVFGGIILYTLKIQPSSEEPEETESDRV